MIYIGLSGWTYAGWRGKFYPKGLIHRKELEFASRAFPTIEINGTHYSLQRPKSFQTWYEQTPEDFLFAIKGSRYITHMRRLKDVKEPLANFFASGVLALREKLGPFLWQFPPTFRYDPELLEAFFQILPRTTTAATRLAKAHGPEVSGRAWTRSTPRRTLRHCLEVRHESFFVPEFFALLRRHDIAFVIADAAGKFPYAEDITSDFVYVRLHGDEELYTSGYTNTALDRWAAKIRLWQTGRQPKNARLFSPRTQTPKGKKDVFVYFDNDAKVKAPGDAQGLRERLKR